MTEEELIRSLLLLSNYTGRDAPERKRLIRSQIDGYFHESVAEIRRLQGILKQAESVEATSNKMFLSLKQKVVERDEEIRCLKKAINDPTACPKCNGCRGDTTTEYVMLWCNECDWVRRD